MQVFKYYSQLLKEIFIEAETGKAEDYRDFSLPPTPYTRHLGNIIQISTFSHTLYFISVLAGREKTVNPLHLCKSTGSAEWHIQINSSFCISLQYQEYYTTSFT